MNYDLQYKVFQPPALSYLTVKIPDNLLKELIIDSKKLEKTKNKASYENHLVGNFENGEQLAIKPNNAEMISGFKSFKELELIKNHMAKTYVDMYFQTSQSLFRPGQTKIELGDMWLNIQREGDFNPVHNHNCKTETGLSSFCWLTFPLHVMKSAVKSNQQGMTYLHWGLTHGSSSKQFMYPKNTGLLPDPGLIVMFPSWLEHVVYPFKGNGERISIASNINIKLE